MVVLTSELSIGCVPLLLKRNRFFHMLVSFANVPQDARLQTLRRGIVFFLGDVIVRFVKEIGGFVEAAYPTQMRIESRMVFEVLPVVGCRPDFGDSLVDFSDCVFLRLF